MSWVPPAEPDPLQILESAERDTDDGAHAQALAKILWLHHNALRYCSGFSAARLSYGLDAWTRLATVYPPARAEFLRTRDEVEAAFRTDPSTSELFHELAALNEHLGDGRRTAELFEQLARNDRATAEGWYCIAEPFLIATGRYETCGSFLNPPWRMSLAADVFRYTMRMAEGRSEAESCRLVSIARSIYAHNVATLVGLLALNRRVQEAERVRDEALVVMDDTEFRALLGTALNGHLPPRFDEFADV